jgi:outer membrane receptor protein involved in Fe transport
VRAPNIEELYSGAYNNFPSYSDPCAGGVTGALRDFCIQEGVPASVIDTFEAADSQVESTQGGNPDLSEEESDTYTAGIVWEPDYWHLDGLQLAVDYYEIKIDDAIDVAGGGPNNLIQLCYDGLNSASEFCQAITRDSTGDIVNVNALNANISQFKTTGVDLQLTYTWNMDNWGIGGDSALFVFNTTGVHVIENSFIPSPGAETRDCEGRFGSPCGQTITGTATPDNKWNTSLTYMTGPLSVRLGWVWIDEVKDTRVDDGTPANELPQPYITSTNYWELSGRWAFNDNIDVTLGVDNLFDNDPPVYGDASVQSNTDPSTYDVLGRRYWAGLTVKF